LLITERDGLITHGKAYLLNLCESPSLDFRDLYLTKLKPKTA
jgi:hypothetical protein